MYNDLNVDVWDRKTRAILDDMVDAKVKRGWFENYEANKEIIKDHLGGYEKMPTAKRVIIVGAGWSLDDNVHELKGIKVPVIACDKIAWKVAKYVRPLAVCALNTEKTQVKEWLRMFKIALANQGWSINDVWLIVPVTVNPEVFEEWTGDKICFVNPQNTCPELCALVQTETGMTPTLRGNNVGHFAMISAISLGAEQIVMLGMTYSYKTVEECLQATRGFHYIAILDVNLTDFVYTTLDWLDTRSEMVNLAIDVSNDVKIVNCSGGGIIYQAGVIEQTDFRAWKQFLNEEEVNDTEGTKKQNNRKAHEGAVGKELRRKQGDDKKDNPLLSSHSESD